MNFKGQLAVMLTIMVAVAVAVSAIPVSEGADGENSGKTIDMGQFLQEMVAEDYDYDGKGITVSWKPSSACTLSTHEDGTNQDCMFYGKDRPITDGNNPGRVQNGNAQYNLFEGVANVSISNVNFVYDYDYGDEDFTLCQLARSGQYTGTFGYADARNAELQFLNSGDLTITGCTFDRAIVSPFGCHGTTEITGCQFGNVYNAYTIKDIYSTNATISGCSFDNCGGGIYFEGDQPKGTYLISGNTFTKMDNATEEKKNSRGLIQFSANGNYSNADITVSDNSSDGETPILNQLNSTITTSVLDTEEIQNCNRFSGTMFVENTSIAASKEIYVDAVDGDDSNDGSTQTTAVKTMSKALELVGSAGTIVLVDDLQLGSQLTISTAVVTIDLGGHTLTASEGFAFSFDNDSHLLNVTADDVTIKNGKIVTTSENKHAINAYGASGLTLIDLVIDASESGKSGVPLQINTSSVILGGRVDLIVSDEMSYASNMDVTDTGDKNDTGSSLTTFKGTELHFSNCLVGFWIDANESGSVRMMFSENTEYYYDTDGFKPYVALIQDALETTGNPVDRVENPASTLIVNTIPEDAMIIIEGYGNVQSGQEVEIAPGTYYVVVSKDGYETERVPVTVSANAVNTVTIEIQESGWGSGGFPPVWDDDDDYVPPIVPSQTDDSGDDDTTTIVACAAAAVVAALIAAYLIIDRRQ